MTDPVFIDVSHWQPDPIDWQAVRASGVVGVIHKATEGESYVDPTLHKHAYEAHGAGLAWATYHFLRPGSIAAQMKHYLETIEPQPGERVCLDHEDSAVSLEALEQAVEYLQADSRNLQVTVYSGHLIKEQLRDAWSPILATTSLWMAHYTAASAPSWPKTTWPVWTAWQYTDNADVPGIEGPVDGNRFNGNVRQCLAWFGPAETEDDEDQPPQVVIDITADDGVEVTVMVNGERR
jgi:lysozyme